MCNLRFKPPHRAIEGLMRLVACFGDERLQKENTCCHKHNPSHMDPYATSSHLLHAQVNFLYSIF